MILSQEAGAFGNNIEKKPQKPRPKLKKYASGSIFCQIILILQNNNSNFLTMKVA